MKNKLSLILNCILVPVAVFCLYRFIREPKVKYVRSADLIYSYEGMKDAQKKQQEVTDGFQAKLDTLQLEFQKAVSRYNQDMLQLSAAERQQREKLLSLQQNNLQQYSSNAGNQLKQKDQEITQGVLNQVNAFVEEYSQKQGYDLVMGTTTDGNILFAREDMDITNEVLKALNENYRSGSSTKESK
ncbi:MAG: OmpH family outer membrane protein [Bacteroidia bacterium]